MSDIWPEISNREREAYYQAGHAVIALRESLGVTRVSIQKEDGASSWIDVSYPRLAQSRLNRSARARSDARSVIRALLAGPAAQARYDFGTPLSYSSLRDFDLLAPGMMEQEVVWRAIALAGKISSNSPSLLRSLWREVNRQIHRTEIWSAIDAVARALLLNGELSGQEVCDVGNHAMRSAE